MKSTLHSASVLDFHEYNQTWLGAVLTYTKREKSGAEYTTFITNEASRVIKIVIHSSRSNILLVRSRSLKTQETIAHTS